MVEIQTISLPFHRHTFLYTYSNLTQKTVMRRQQVLFDCDYFNRILDVIKQCHSNQ